MAIWRNILTALWSAILGGGAAFALVTFMRDLQGRDFGSLPLTAQLALGCTGVIAVSALGSFVWVRMLWGAVAGIVGILFLAFTGWQGGLTTGGDMGLQALITLLIPSALILLGCLAFLLWDLEVRLHQKSRAEAPLKAF